jgi:hypothetical protein
MTFRIIQQGRPLKWLCPHCEMEIEAEMLSEPDPHRAYVCFFCGWRRSLAMMEYYGFVREAEPATASSGGGSGSHHGDHATAEAADFGT